MSEGFVYILRGTSGRYYIGSTQDIEKRLIRHNGGRVHSSKRLGLPLELVACKRVPDEISARRLEASLKRWKNPAKVIEYLQQDIRIRLKK